MPKATCSICGEIQEVARKHWGSLDYSYHVCSKECVFNWITSSKREEPSGLIEAQGPVGRAYRSYSNKLETFYRSDYEKYFAEEAVGRGFVMFFERYCFVFRGKYYIPDFFVMGYNCFIEVKGLWGVGAKKKLRLLREARPDVDLLVVPWTLKKEFYPDGK